MAAQYGGLYPDNFQQYVDQVGTHCAEVGGEERTLSLRIPSAA